MSRPRFLRSVVFLSAFVAPIVVSSAQRQNTSEPLASPSPLSSRRAAPTKIGQGVPIPGARFDPRQRLHGRGTSTPQTTSLADPLTAATLATGMSLSEHGLYRGTRVQLRWLYGAFCGSCGCERRRQA